MVSFLPSHLDATTLHFWRLHLAFACPPLTIIADRPHRPRPDEDHRPLAHRRRRLAASSTPHLTSPDIAAPRPPCLPPPLALPLPQGHSSRTLPGPPCRSSVHRCRVGPCAGCRPPGSRVEHRRSRRPHRTGPLAIRRPCHRVAPQSTVIAHRLPDAPPMLTGHRPAVHRCQPPPCGLLPTGESKRFEIWMSWMIWWMLICMKFEWMVNLS
jgi:hypothetical protein